jgi:ABC-type thiamin/hydroxymethylpyrimidine transport system permease subunit
VRKTAKEMAAQPKAAAKRVVDVVRVDKPVPIPIAPKGVEKVGWNRFGGVISVLASPIAAFGDLDNVTKGIVCAAAVIVGIMVYYRGEAIAARARALLRVFDGESNGSSDVAGK